MGFLGTKRELLRSYILVYYKLAKLSESNLSLVSEKKIDSKNGLLWTLTRKDEPERRTAPYPYTFGLNMPLAPP